MNDNRIIRMHNDKLHRMILHVARLTVTPYQQVFNELCDYIIEGHVVGEYTHHILIERLLEERAY